MSDFKTVQALLRRDLTSFIHRTFQTVSPGTPYLHNWHIEAIAYHLERCYRGEINRLIITLPPRHLKSIAASVAYPAWLLGQDPTRKIITVSYAQDLATKHALDTRTVMTTPWYRRCFPRTRLHPDKNSQTECMTTARGFRLATSVGGTLTGRGGNLIIIDDPHKAEEAFSETKRQAAIDWYRTTLLSRLDNKHEDTLIVIQQRLHENDLAGYLLESGDWVHLNIPAIAEEEQCIPIGKDRVHIRKPGDALHAAREPLSVLDTIKTTIGSYAFAGQYQQRPASLGGGMIKWDWFEHYDAAPKPEKVDGDQIVQSWDTASKAEARHDWSVCTTWLIKNNRYYLLQVTRIRLEFPDLERHIQSLAEEWRADYVLIEDKGAGTQLIQDLQRESSLNLIGCVPKDDKVTRMMAVTPPIEAGRVWLPQEAAWLADFQHEILHFPNGKHDDQVDSLSQFLQWANDRPLPFDVDSIIVVPSIMTSADWP